MVHRHSGTFLQTLTSYQIYLRDALSPLYFFTSRMAHCYPPRLMAQCNYGTLSPPSCSRPPQSAIHECFLLLASTAPPPACPQPPLRCPLLSSSSPPTRLPSLWGSLMAVSASFTWRPGDRSTTLSRRLPNQVRISFSYNYPL